MIIHDPSPENGSYNIAIDQIDTDSTFMKSDTVNEASFV